MSEKQSSETENLLEEFSDILTNLPVKTDIIEQTIKLTTSDPVRSKPNPVPVAVRQNLKEEAETLLKMGVFEVPAGADPGGRGARPPPRHEKKKPEGEKKKETKKKRKRRKKY